MTLDDVMNALAAKAHPATKKTLLRHGAPEPLFGVRIGDLKPLVQQLRGEQQLALDLYATGNSDAMYLAGLIADGAQMTRRQLDHWAREATWQMLAGSTVPNVAAEHPQAVAMAGKWIDSPRELIAVAGWGTLAAVAATVSDADLPIETLSELLDRCVGSLHRSPDRARYMMNNFVISVGTYVAPLAEAALAAARRIGPVDCDMGDTACRVPDAESSIVKSRRGAAVAPKRRSTKC